MACQRYESIGGGFSSGREAPVKYNESLSWTERDFRATRACPLRGQEVLPLKPQIGCNLTLWAWSGSVPAPPHRTTRLGYNIAHVAG